MRHLRLLSLFASLIAVFVLAACGDDEGDSSTTASATTAEADCSPEALETVSDGVLTVGTDSPAYPPYFVDDDPTNGEGFESAVAYAIADELGFTADQVEWTVVPFNASYAPGPKDFDFDVNQISITPKRAEQVDFSSPYFENNQAILALEDSPAAGATSIADLADANIGVQIGTTSLDAVEDVIQPVNDPQVFDNSNDVVSALKQGSVDAIVVDLYTAIYLRDAEVSGSVVVGQFPAPGGDEWGALLSKDSPLTACVSQAVDTLKASGELDAIETEWMSESAQAPVLE